MHWFATLTEAKQLIESWRREYNESRPHRSLGERTPSEFANCRKLALKVLQEKGTGQDLCPDAKIRAGCLNQLLAINGDFRRFLPPSDETEARLIAANRNWVFSESKNHPAAITAARTY